MKRYSQTQKWLRQMFDPHAGGPQRFLANLEAGAHKYAWEVQARKLVALYRLL